MREVTRLFADVKCQVEDLHGLAIEGQVSDQPVEVLRALADCIAAGVNSISRSLLHIRLECDQYD